MAVRKRLTSSFPQGTRLRWTFRSVRIFSVHAVTTTMPSTVSGPRDDALRASSFITDPRTTNIMGFLGFSSFLRLLCGDGTVTSSQKLQAKAHLIMRTWQSSVQVTLGNLCMRSSSFRGARLHFFPSIQLYHLNLFLSCKLSWIILSTNFNSPLSAMISVIPHVFTELGGGLRGFQEFTPLASN